MIAAALIISFFFACFALFWTQKLDEDKQKRADYVYNTLNAFNIIFASIAMAYVYTRLNKGGMSSELKSQISRRYLEFVMIFVILSLPINHLFQPDYKYNESRGKYVGGTHYATGFWTPVCGFGIIMAISRLRDPLIWIKT